VRELRRHNVKRCFYFDIPFLRQRGYLHAPKSGAIAWETTLWKENASIGIRSYIDHYGNRGFLVIHYYQMNLVSGKMEEYKYEVNLTTTNCNYGSVRYWFECPLSVNGEECGRRVGKLYLPPGSKYFGCRHCHNLTYRSQKEHDKRIDALIGNPWGINRLLKSRKFSDNLLALRAVYKGRGLV